MRYFLNFSYLGKNYHGWQIQPNATSVQEILQDRVSKILGVTTILTAAGRTDTGVHAKQMTAHFDTEIEIRSDFVYRINAFLPQDIAVQSIKQVKKEAHARFDAIERTYQYFIHYQKNPFLSEVSWYWNYQKLDVNKMNEAAEILYEMTDFTSFAKLHTDNKTNICQVKTAKWIQQNENLIFTICADRFLRNMVRSIVGTLVEVGSGKLSKSDFKEIIVKKDRKFAAASAPAHGLFLLDVKYPDELFI
ncbi:MAG: tRNA pseudouridine(38-40) synthase TruA [Flavobacteriaceae bacterium]|nr:tRNA pseudouridine(38-40) synthase TruA [Flavobacteriaceae bacterium]